MFNQGIFSPPGGASGAITGSGTLNYVAKFTPSGSVIGNSQIFDNGTNVGIGTNTPSDLFNVYRAATSQLQFNTNGLNIIGDTDFDGISLYKNGKEGGLRIDTQYPWIYLRKSGQDNFQLFGGDSKTIAIVRESLEWRDATSNFVYEFVNTTTGFRSLQAPTASTGLGATAMLHIKGSGATSATYSLKIEGSTGTALFQVKDDGSIFTTTGINTTAGDSATINACSGRFRKDTSGSTFTLTNSFITANSIIMLTQASDSGVTGFDFYVVAGAGSAVITFTTSGVAAAPTSNTDMNFWIIN